MELRDFIGKTVKYIRSTMSGDEGLRIEFEDGTYIDIAYSGEEGFTEIGVRI